MVQQKHNSAWRSKLLGCSTGGSAGCRYRTILCGHVTVMLAVIGWLAGAAAPAAEISVEQAWAALAAYQYGQDMAPLLAIDREVIRAMNSPDARAACAKRLASLLESEQTTLAARQYICLQLRQIGTPSEVSVLAKLLREDETSEMARYALESIPGDESMGALRDALSYLDGKLLIGVMNSVAARKDQASVPLLQRLADSNDGDVAAAALWALGNIAGEQASMFLKDRAVKTGLPTPEKLAVPMLRCADTLADEGNLEQARGIYKWLSAKEQAEGIRRAALGGLLRLEGENAPSVIRQWLGGADVDRRRVAASRLKSLSDAQLDQLIAQLQVLPVDAQLAVVDASVVRRGKKILPFARTLIKSNTPSLKIAGIRCLGVAGDASVTDELIALLASDPEVADAAQESLVRLPRADIVPPLLDALKNKPAIRTRVIDVLVELKCYDAIDPLIEIASQTDPEQYAPALEGLRGIADPDKTDLPRLVNLLLRTEPGKHRDEVEKTIVIVCDKLPPGTDRSAIVLDSARNLVSSDLPKYLPLLGRLGGSRALQLIKNSLAGEDAAIRDAAVRALCNWPNADVAGELWELAKTSPNAAHRRWALRAYIRVITLKSDRPERETLSMLQRAMQLAESADERRLAIERAATIRLMDTVDWAASLLDDPELSQTACRTIVELAHHRFLRQPNIERFGPILEKVSRISKDAEVVERARRYRLGL